MEAYQVPKLECGENMCAAVILLLSVSGTGAVVGNQRDRLLPGDVKV